MAVQDELCAWVVQALKALGGAGSVVDVCEQIWLSHEARLRDSRTLFYTWQYQVRWAATKLRKDGALRAADASPPGVWELAPEGLRGTLSQHPLDLEGS